MKQQLRKLFTEHAVYTKMYITSALHTLPDLEVLTNRLLRNQSDIGDFVKPIIGSNNGNKLTSLLKEHILAAAGAVNAVKTKTGIDEAVKKVFANSEQVSKFLNSLNPSKLPLSEVHQMFDQHNKYVIQMTQLHNSGSYKEEIETYDKYYEHMLMFSDALYEALQPDNKTHYVYYKHK